jgi:hypothetical protein
MSTAFNLVIDALTAHGSAVRTLGSDKAEAQCPAHEDRSASLSISIGRNQPVLLHCHTGVCQPKDIAEAANIPWDVISKRGNDKPADDLWMICVKRQGHRGVATYRYRDASGSVVLGVSRCDHKCFAQWRPDETQWSGRTWGITLPDGTKAGAGIPYRLPDLLAADTEDVIYIVEGEKDADMLWSLGIPATCNSGGAGKWTDAHAQWLAGRDVIVVADRDEAGEKHAVTVVNSLWLIARSIEIAQAVNGKDVSDHLAAGGTIGTLSRIYTAKSCASVVAA